MGDRVRMRHSDDMPFQKGKGIVKNHAKGKVFPSFEVWAENLLTVYPCEEVLPLVIINIAPLAFCCLSHDYRFLFFFLFFFK